MIIGIGEDQIAEAIAQGDLNLTAIVRHLAREWVDDGHTPLVEFEGVGEALANSRSAPAITEFGGKLAEIAIQYDEKLLKHEMEESDDRARA